MSEQPTDNVFGSDIKTGMPPDNLHKQGGEKTVDDILNAIDQRFGAKPDAPAVAPVPAKDPATPEADVVKAAAANIDTGSKALDIAVTSFLKSTGASDADVQRAVRHAVEYGDSSMIDAEFLKEKFGDRSAEALQLAEAVVEQGVARRESLVQAVYSSAGSEDQWKANLSVYKEHAPAGLQKAIQLMFDSGDDAAVKEAASLVNEYAKNSGVFVQGGQRMRPGSGPAASQGLSAKDFQAAIGQLTQGSRTYTQDYNRLVELRRLGKQLGK